MNMSMASAAGAKEVNSVVAARPEATKTRAPRDTSLFAFAESRTSSLRDARGTTAARFEEWFEESDARAEEVGARAVDARACVAIVVARNCGRARRNAGAAKSANTKKIRCNAD
jgi:hypothetical protein